MWNRKEKVCDGPGSFFTTLKKKKKTLTILLTIQNDFGLNTQDLGKFGGFKNESYDLPTPFYLTSVEPTSCQQAV